MQSFKSYCCDTAIPRTSSISSRRRKGQERSNGSHKAKMSECGAMTLLQQREGNFHSGSHNSLKSKQFGWNDNHVGFGNISWRKSRWGNNGAYGEILSATCSIIINPSIPTALQTSPKCGFKWPASPSCVCNLNWKLKVDLGPEFRAGAEGCHCPEFACVNTMEKVAAGLYNIWKRVLFANKVKDPW